MINSFPLCSSRAALPKAYGKDTEDDDFLAAGKIERGDEWNGKYKDEYIGRDGDASLAGSRGATLG